MHFVQTCLTRCGLDLQMLLHIAEAALCQILPYITMKYHRVVQVFVLTMRHDQKQAIYWLMAQPRDCLCVQKDVASVCFACTTLADALRVQLHLRPMLGASAEKTVLLYKARRLSSP